MSIAKKLAPSELVEKGGVLQSVPKPVEELVKDEKELHARTMQAVDKALRAHGVSLTGTELTHVGAAIADFVQEEITREVTGEETPAEAEEPRKKTKRRTSDD